MNQAASPKRTAVFAMWTVVCLGSLTGCSKSGPSVGSAKSDVVDVTVQTIVPSRLQDVLELDGSVAAGQSVNLMARVAGVLRAIHFRDGELVRRDQLLFTIEPESYQQQVNLNQARLAQTRSDYGRQAQLLKENATSQASVDTALANLQQAEANLALAMINLGYTQVRAPFDGVIGRHQVDVGNYVGATAGGTWLATIQQLSPAYVNAAIGERDVLRLRAKPAGTNRADAAGRVAVQARLQGEAQAVEHGELDFVDRQFSQGTGTLAVRGRFANTKQHLVPGFYAKLVIDLGQPRDTLLVPRSALLVDQQGQYVYVAEDGVARRRAVQTVPAHGEAVEVVRGLRAGELLIVAGNSKVTEGRAVHSQSASASLIPANR